MTMADERNPTPEDSGGQMFYARDDKGLKQDAWIHEPILEDSDADLFFRLQVIRDHVDDGHPLEDAVDLFGGEEMQRAFAAGKFTLDDIDATLRASAESE